MGTGLAIDTLGGVRITRRGEPVVGLTTRKTEALLIYLACTRRPQPREVLADLFWEDRTQSQAMSNLRGSLSNLNQVVGDCLTISRTEVALHPSAQVRLDAAELDDGLNALLRQGRLTPVTAGQAAEILALYRGEFLEGFTVFDCPQFEQWAVRERERLHHLAVDRLSELVAFEIEQKSYQPGMAHASRLLELDPLNENAHRQMMRLLAFSGQRNAALAQYETCQKLLQGELGVKPDAETALLYHQIREGGLEPGRAQDGLPSGTVTFLYTDIEGSTRLLSRLKKDYATVLAEQRDLLRASFERWRGREMDTQGDSFFVAFSQAMDALQCVIEAQHALAGHAWPEGVTVRARMGLHTGEPIIARTGYVGMDVVRAARIMNSGHGGQVLLSQTTRDLVFQDLPPGASLIDLGAHKLKDLRFPQQIYQLVMEDLPGAFPPLKTLSTEEEPPAVGDPPFKGLQYFGEEDAPLFFGRSQVTQRLVDAVAEERFLAVIGASGSGKSSVVRAGLIPALKKRQPGCWQIVLLTPTAHPIESLAIALTHGAGSVITTTTLMDDLKQEPRALHAFALKRIPPATREELHMLLVIDQFEELFTLCREAGERQAFVDNLLTAAAAAHGPVHVLITLRADFYEHLAEYSGLRECVAKHQEYLGAMRTEELRQAIEEPARLGGWEFSPGLVELMLHEVGAEDGSQPEPGALPLLSHALLETWKHRRGILMNLKAYGESGGVRKAIARTAEHLYTNELTPAQQQIARSIFLRLTELGEGTQDTRRRATLQELMPSAQSGDPKDFEDVLVKLADARLIITSESTAEVAHEALIREWPSLREWLMQDREGLRLQRQLSAAAQEWQLLERDPGVLYRGARLAQAVEWVKANPRALNEQEQAFLEASQALVDQEEAEKETARRRELDAARRLAETERQRAEAERQRAEAENLRAEEQALYAKRQRQRAIYLSLALAAAVIMIGVAAWFGKLSLDNAGQASRNLSAARLASTRAVAQQSTAESASRLAIAQQSTAESASRLAQAEANTRATAEAKAEDEARLAFSRELAAASATSLTADPQRGLLLAMQAVKTHDTPQAEAALHQAIQGSRLRDTFSLNTRSLVGLEISPDGRQVAAISEDDNIYLWSMDATGTRIDRADPRAFPNPVDFDMSSTTAGYTLDFSPDSRWLVSVSEKQSARIWEVATGKVVQVLSGHTGDVICVAFSPDGQRVATGSMDGTVKIWEAATGTALQTLAGSAAPAGSIVFSSDGKRMVTGAANWQVDAWEAQPTTANPRNFVKSYTLQLEKIGDGIGSLAINPAGNRLAVGTNTNLVVYDIGSASATSAPVMLLNIYTDDNILNEVEYSKTGDLLYTGGSDGESKVWNAITGQQLFNLPGKDSVGAIAVNQQGTRFLTAGYDGVVNTWDIDPASNQEWFTLGGGLPSTGELSADGTRLLFVKDSGKEGEVMVETWQVTPDGLGKAPVRSVTMPLVTFAWSSNDLTQIAHWREDQTARVINLEVWDTATGQMIRSFPVFKSPVQSGPVCKWGVDCVNVGPFSPDDTRVVTRSQSGPVSLWDVKTGRLVREFEGSGGPWGFVNFSPDGTLLSTAGTDGKVAWIWDIRTGNLVTKLEGHTGGVFGASFSPDGKRIITGSMDTTARVWDARTGEQQQRLIQQSAYVHDASFSPDGRYLITGNFSMRAIIWDPDSGKQLLEFNGYVARITPDGKYIITRHTDGSVRGFYLDANDLLTLARSRLLRTWTEQECVIYLRANTCPAAP